MRERVRGEGEGEGGIRGARERVGEGARGGPQRLPCERERSKSREGACLWCGHVTCMRKRCLLRREMTEAQSDESSPPESSTPYGTSAIMLRGWGGRRGRD